MNTSMIPSRIGDSTRWLLLILLLAVPALLGAAMAYAVMLIALGTAVVFAFMRPSPFRLDATGLTLVLAYCFFFALVAVTALVRQDPAELESGLNLIALLLYVPLFSLLSRNPRRGNAALVALLAAIGVAVTIAIAAYEVGILGILRAGGNTTPDAIRFAATAVLLGFLVLIGVRVMISRWRWLLLLAPLIAMVAVGLSGSRGPLLAAPAAALFAAFYLITNRRWALAAIAAVGALFLVLLLGAELLGFGRLASILDIAQRLAAGESAGETAADLRLDIWQAGFKSFLDSPWIGHGWSQITRVPQQYIESGINLRHYSHLHNDPLDFLVAFGVLGLPCYLMIVAAPLIGAFRSPHDSLRSTRIYGCLILTAVYVIGGQTSLMLGFEYQTVLYVGISAVLLGFCRDPVPAP